MHVRAVRGSRTLAKTGCHSRQDKLSVNRGVACQKHFCPVRGSSTISRRCHAVGVGSYRKGTNTYAGAINVTRRHCDECKIYQKTLWDTYFYVSVQACLHSDRTFFSTFGGEYSVIDKPPCFQWIFVGV